MPRSKRGTKRIISTEQAMKAAVQDILETHMSLKVAGDKHKMIHAHKGAKQIGTMTYGERGSNVTIIAAVSGVGNAIPPTFIFPRVNFKQHMLKGAPPGLVGESNPSGEPHVLMYDIHESHISLAVIKRAKEMGLHLLTIPPHTNHKLQPLGHPVFGPFKNYYDKAVSEGMCTSGNVGRLVTIYDICEIAGKAYDLAFTPGDIVSGFKISGNIPLNKNIFDDSEFLRLYVTDRPLPTSNDGNVPFSANNSLTSPLQKAFFKMRH
ncbi:hypothetical protein ILUMI_14066 [Ignelater luminosus]|uniref:DDE-1 domain-containing protein n=1 Tax=Ignelater luminosus TaxID=2038154 RepID=A0A8K0G836_IGNLU|nr:hypothetical protein ILUMI_14066 [Ignelater luminosus]